MQQNKEKKQEYLREQILEPGYDAEDFIQFLSSYQVGNDIEEIKFKQLKQIVQAYCKKKSEETYATTKACKQVGFDQNSIIKENQKGTNNIKYDKYGFVEPQLTKVFKCRKIKSQQLLEQKLHIEVQIPQRKSIGGFFGVGKTSFWAFQIITYNKKWRVKRRYSDFIWLRSMLLKFFPTHIIPPLPKKKASKKSQRDISKRMKILTYFLRDIACYPQMVSNKFVQGFLSLDKDSQFQKLKKQGTNAHCFEAIVALQTPTGEVKVSLSQDQKSFNQQLLAFTSQAEIIYKSVNKNAKDLQACILQKKDIMHTIGDQFGQLFIALAKFNQKVPQFAQTSLSHSYIQLNNMMIEWGNIIRNQFDFIEKSFLPFFRYSRHQLYSFKELHSKVFEFEQEYFKNRSVLEKRKQKLFQQNDINKWDIRPSDLESIPLSATKNKAQAFEYMLPKQTFELDKLRLNYAFYSSQFSSHSENRLQQIAQKFNQNFKQFAINIKVNTQQLAVLWTQVATNFANPLRKLQVMRSELGTSNIQENEKDQEYEQN